MKRFFSLVTILISLSASADVLPTYLKALKGVVLNDLLRTSAFTFAPGTLKKCARKEVVDMVVFDCSTDGVSATVTDGADSRTFEFTELKVWFKYHKDYGHFNEYTFKGNWRGNADTMALTSPIRLVLWYQRSAPEQVKGFLEMTSFGVTRSIQATPQ
jgi:hypothetical protein